MWHWNNEKEKTKIRKERREKEVNFNNWHCVCLTVNSQQFGLTLPVKHSSVSLSNVLQR